MKKCPFCSKEIHDEAIKCKHCKASLGRVKTKKEIAFNDKLLEFGKIFGILWSGFGYFYIAKDIFLDIPGTHMHYFIWYIIPGAVIYQICENLSPEEKKLNFSKLLTTKQAVIIMTVIIGCIFCFIIKYLFLLNQS